MKKIKNIRKLKSQQLLEFILLIPFMIIIIGILTEYTYALNINMTLSEALKAVSANIYSEIKPGMNSGDIKSLIETDFTKYLQDNNIPTNPVNNIQIGYFIKDRTAVFMASYTYIPVFTLPNFYFKIMPEKFNFFTTSAVPSAFLGENNYTSYIDSLALDGVWSSSGSFSSESDFNTSKKGIMKNDASGGRNKMLFLIQTTAAVLSKPYVLVNWNGTIQTIGTNTYTVDTDTGKLYQCNAAGTVCTYVERFFDYLTTNNYRNIIFIHDTAVPSDLSLLSTYWITPAGSTDLSPSSVDGILKRQLALVNSSGSIGNYDNKDVYSYNSDVSYGNTYTTEYFGSMVFVYDKSQDSISNIKLGETAPAYSYSF